MKELPSNGANARYGEHGQDLAFKDLMSIPDIIAFLASSLLPEYGNETVEEIRRRIDSDKRYSAKRYATELKRPASTGLLDSAIRMSVPDGDGDEYVFLHIEGQAAMPNLHELFSRADAYLSAIISNQDTDGGRNYSKISSATGIWVLTKPPAHFRNMVDGLEFARIYPDEPGLGFTPKDLRRMRMFFVGLDGNGEEMPYNEGDGRRKAVRILNSLFRKTNEEEFGKIAREAFQTDDPKLEELVKEGLVRYETMTEATRREGEEKGKVDILALMQRLFSDGRTEDAMRASSDTRYCNMLLMEYGLA